MPGRGIWRRRFSDCPSWATYSQRIWHVFARCWIRSCEKSLIHTAVILAAGMGTRLREHLSDRPKGLMCIGDRPIIEESFLRLQGVGIQRLILVTGHQADQYESMAANWGGFCTTVHNPRFSESGSMYSLYCARDSLEPPFLLLESDLVYESRALQQIMAHPCEDAILLSGPTHAGDEVFVETRAGQLVAMSHSTVGRSLA